MVSNYKYWWIVLFVIGILFILSSLVASFLLLGVVVNIETMAELSPMSFFYAIESLVTAILGTAFLISSFILRSKYIGQKL